MNTQSHSDIFLNTPNVNLPEFISYKNISLTKTHYAATLCFKRAERFMEEYSFLEDLTNLIKKYFGNLGILYSNGLTSQYENLKQEVIEKNNIGLILCGLNEKIFINKYLQQNETKPIDLTISSITRTLLKKYFTDNEINLMCLSTPNFHIYYNIEDETKYNDTFKGNTRYNRS